jgi:hypothetical protein
MVYVLTVGNPSGARRRARCKVFNDQVRRPIPVAIWRPMELGQDPFAFGWAVQHRRWSTAAPGFHRR